MIDQTYASRLRLEDNLRHYASSKYQLIDRFLVSFIKFFGHFGMPR